MTCPTCSDTGAVLNLDGSHGFCACPSGQRFAKPTLPMDIMAAVERLDSDRRQLLIALVLARWCQRCGGELETATEFVKCCPRCK